MAENIGRTQHLVLFENGGTEMNLKAWQLAVHNNAKAHGWWDGEERSFGELIALCHSELSEALEEYRNGRKPDETYYSCHLDGVSPDDECADTDHSCYFRTGKKGTCEKAKPEGIPAELADVVIRIMDMCGHYGIDLEKAIIEKHNYNLGRPFRHGGKTL